jgi:hypothetical protein
MATSRRRPGHSASVGLRVDDRFAPVSTVNCGGIWSSRLAATNPTGSGPDRRRFGADVPRVEGSRAHFGAPNRACSPTLRRRGLPGAGLLASACGSRHPRRAVATPERRGPDGCGAELVSNAPLTRPPVATVAEGRVDFHVEGTLKGNKAQRKDRACRTGNGATTLRTRRRSKASKSASEAQTRVDGSTWQRVSRERDDAPGGTARGQRPW